mgnify:CR=1 FL=1
MLKGLVALLPVGLTVYLVYWLAVAAETLFSRVLKLVIPDTAYWPGLGLVAGLALLYATGLAVNAYVVRRALRVSSRISVATSTIVFLWASRTIGLMTPNLVLAV